MKKHILALLLGAVIVLPLGFPVYWEILQKDKLKKEILELTQINAELNSSIKTLQIEQSSMKSIIVANEVEIGYWCLVHDYMKQRHPVEAVAVEAEVNKLYGIKNCEK